ncbi:MAG: DUF2087 domain-containing protein [Dermabacter sp.]|nr:DUF2087 domain-containing protein [Dermabacter sp.]
MNDRVTVSAGEAIRRARMVLSALATPKLRAGLASRISTQPAPADTGATMPFDWINSTNDVDTPLLRATITALESCVAEDRILHVDRLAELPSTSDQRRLTSAAIVHLVYARVGSSKSLTEGELNAAILMFAADCANVRRDAVDSGILHRTPDGSAYQLVDTDPQH